MNNYENKTITSIECPKCHKPVLAFYYICPNCGTTLDGLNSKKKGQTSRTKRKILIITIAACAIVTLGLLWLIGGYIIRESSTNSHYSVSTNSSNKDSSSSNKQDKEDSTSIPDDLQAALALYAEKKVSNHLLSPSTAKFPLYSKYTYNRKGNVYTINGYVDAKNLYGTELRKKWGVMVEYDGTYNRLICVVIDGETYFD